METQIAGTTVEVTDEGYLKDIFVARSSKMSLTGTPIVLSKQVIVRLS